MFGLHKEDNWWGIYDQINISLVTAPLTKCNMADKFPTNLCWLKTKFWKANNMHPFLRSALPFSRQSRCIFQNLVRFNFNGRFGYHQPQIRAPFSNTFSRPRSINNPYLSVRGFRTSQPRLAAPLAALLVKLAGPLSKVIKLAAVVGGR